MESCPISTNNIHVINVHKCNKEIKSTREDSGGIVEPPCLYQDGINSIKRPQLSLNMFTTISYSKRKEIEIRQSWSLSEYLLRITRLAHGQSYLIIFCPNSNEKLTKSEIMSS